MRAPRPTPAQAMLPGPAAVAASLAGAAAIVVLGIALAVGADWATQLWPLPAGPLTHAFLGAILLAIGAPVAWIAASGEWGAAATGGSFPAVALGALGAYLWALAAAGDPDVGAAAPVVLTVLAAWSAGFALWARRVPLRDGRSSPVAVRIAFVAFALVLVAAGSALAARVDGVLPWAVSGRTSVAIGLVFLGASLPYAAAARSGRWHAARGPLLGFAVYDLALLPPLLARVDEVEGTAAISLGLYVGVLAVSLALALAYLVVDPRTRGWRPSAG
ncbi:MAG: hypothetical protein R3C15_18965 [Thermoleophilia bacterium]